ncbi:MAG: SDR family oxidoreductase [Deferrisomatales bacterium]
MADGPVILITGTSKGIGRHLAGYYLERGYRVVGCSRGPSDLTEEGYTHHQVDVTDERGVKGLFRRIRSEHGRLDALVNNAGIASMNHCLLTPLDTASRVLSTNVLGPFLFCREGAKLMGRTGGGRIVNFTTVAVPLRLEGEAIYAASKAAVDALTRILARELAPRNVTVNAVGPTPIRTDLIAGVPRGTLDALVARQAIPRYGEFRDVTNVIDFFLRAESDFVTGQIVYLGGIG